ncbi:MULTISPECIES: SprT family zinc-dependent metalloprotease [unclassified Brenneria]|uniref:SprT family zinc-dependent metalloprotease n=1 Tax=unclassified Brenneria TaxID=2634434 RepID=UPI001553A6A7|nr:MULTISPECIES: SprT family zinc-dependent metalloprotease [unclassified Brenneria]MBJ7222762.1 SprT family zinc-dependent metalloprotease [Brenneria sp. L3-3C-1]MEE3644006.1 SprT family zinc-dependent metalloprotease [Brenneria sp. L3_3C_1]MEE3651892.1 SprT family zinc-dependent metalloprotease [Brenneria sp. HEZEL_4_2_4]NPD01852.1 SprT family zinc-dependent metalloprotease [Brenneria sp. hezel4-2-4]
MNTPRIPIAHHQAVMRCLRDKLRLANLALNTHYPEPAVNYQQRGSTAGSAWLQHWEIRLNPVLLQENQQSFVDEVVPHELAHLLVFARFGKVAPHGKEWRWMMEEVLQTPARRTHRFAVKSVQGKTFPYQCGCRQHELSVRRHNRVLRGETEYRCRHCGRMLHFIVTNSI